MKFDKYNIFCISIVKSPKKFTTIKSSHYNNERTHDYDKRFQTFYFYFYCSKDVDENLKHEIESNIKSYESLAENKIKNEINFFLTRF